MPYAESQLPSVRQAKAGLQPHTRQEPGVQLDVQNGTLDEERENKTYGPPSGVRSSRRGAAQVSLQGHG